MSALDLDQWRQRWAALEPRQRRLFGGAAAVIGALILYEFVWHPVVQKRSELILSMPGLRVEAEQFHRNATDVERLKTATTQRGAVTSIATMVDSAIARANLRGQLKSVQSLGPDRVQLNFSAVSFDALTRLLADLGQSGAITVESTQLSAADVGRVNVQSLVVRLAGATDVNAGSR